MAQINQVVLVVLSVMLIGLLTSSVGANVRGGQPFVSNYWPTALFFRVVSLLGWVIVPFGGTFFLTVANAGYLISSLCVCLLFRTWTHGITKRMLWISWIIIFVCIVFFEFLRQQPGSYLYRVILISTTVELFCFWQLYELLKLSKHDRSWTLRVLQFAFFAHTVFAFVRMVSTILHPIPAVTNIHEQPLFETIMFFGLMGSGVFNFVMISSYQYQRLWTADVMTLDELSKTSRELALTQKAQKEISTLNRSLELMLEEKNQLIKSLTLSQKASNMGTMVSSLAHELNQPLGVIRLNNDFLEQSLASHGDLNKYKVVLEQLQQSEVRASTIIDRLRRFFIKGKEEYVPQNLSTLIHEVQAIVATEAQSRKIKIDLDVAPNIMVLGDLSQLQMVVLNLFNNAMQAVLENPESKLIHVQLSQTKAGVVLEIKDNGPGVSYKNLGDIFELFHTTKEQGMGVGLWLSRAIMELHGGTISVANPGEPGAIFRLVFPSADIDK